MAGNDSNHSKAGDCFDSAEEKFRVLNERLMAANEELTAAEEELRQQCDELIVREADIQRHNLILTSLHETAKGLLQRLDLYDVLAAIVSNAAELIGTSHGFINILDEEQAVFERKIGLGYYAQDVGRKTGLTEGFGGQIYKTGEITVIDDYGASDNRLSGLFFDRIFKVVLVPLKKENKVIGVFGLSYLEPNRNFTDHQFDLLDRFADLASIALVNAYLHSSLAASEQKLKKSNEDITTVHEELLAADEELRQQFDELLIKEEALQISEAKHRAIFEAANDGIYIHDLATGEILDINKKACELFGYTKAEILSGGFRVIGTGEAPYSENEARQWLMRAAAGEPQLFEWQNKHKDGHFIWVEINLRHALIGKEDRILAIVRDISERKVQEKAIRRMAYYDSLTGLPNRRYLQERLDQELEKARQGEATGAVLFVDIDDLKMINDTLGHSYGDGVIVKAGAYLYAEAEEDAVVARIGGDEFIILLPDESDREKVAQVADNMVKLLSRDYEIGASRTHMSASIGIALYPLHGHTAEDIFKNADLALYSAKGSGKNTWRFYDPNLQTIAYENMMLKRGLREAIARKELALHYQPLVDANSGDVISFEALLRWTSAGCEAVSPARFIPLAEESDTINIIGKWVIEEACRFASKLAEVGKGDIRVSVNVSPRQLVADDFVEIVSQAIVSAGIKPSQLAIEITENALITSLEDSINKLGELRSIGVHLSLDDFGTGYSSLTYLRSLPVGMLKIDKSFIDQIVSDEAQLKFICSIVNMAHVLGLTVVAEGVESEEQMEKLIECKCDFIQGYFISRPAPEKEAILFLDRSRRYAL